MLQFYKDNMKLVHKFVLNQVAIGLFGFMVVFVMSSFGFAAEMAATVFSTLFFLSLLYDNAWDEGARDKNRISNGRMEFKPFLGAKIALMAYIPTFVLLFFSLVNGILELFGITFMNGVCLVTNAIVLFFSHGMYLGFSSWYNTLLGTGYSSIFLTLFFFALMIPAIFAYTLGYYLGAKDLQIKMLFGAAPSNDAPKKKNDAPPKK